MPEKIIEIGIAIEVENNCNTNMFYPDFDFDFEKDISEAIRAKVNDVGLQASGIQLPAQPERR